MGPGCGHRLSSRMSIKSAFAFTRTCLSIGGLNLETLLLNMTFTPSSNALLLPVNVGILVTLEFILFGEEIIGLS